MQGRLCAMAQKRARSRSQVPRTFSALLSLLLVTQAAPPIAPLNMSSAPLYQRSSLLPAFTHCDGWPQLPVESGTAEYRDDVSGAALNPDAGPNPALALALALTLAPALALARALTL